MRPRASMLIAPPHPYGFPSSQTENRAAEGYRACPLWLADPATAGSLGYN